MQDSENTKSLEGRSYRSNPLSVPISILLAGVLIAGAIYMSNKNNASNTSRNNSANTSAVAGATTGNTANAPTGTPQTATVSISGSPMEGSSNAKVTIVAFEDFQCPYCYDWTTQTLPTLMSKYVNSGKANIVYKYLPLTTIHQYAQISSTAGACAQQQGNDQFWKMYNSMFTNQGQWTTLSDQNAVIGALEGYASGDGLDSNKFNSCITGSVPSNVTTDESQASSLQFTGTPTFIIGTRNGDNVKGTVILGAVPESNFESAINQAIGG